MTTSTEPTTDTQPATDIDLLAALAAARMSGCPEPLQLTVGWGRRASVHVQDSDQADAWVIWWTARHHVADWSIWHDRHDRTHHHRRGQWRGAEITVTYLTRDRAEVTA